jgi:hypothetical protein
MADLTPLDEKLAEVLGLAQAAQAAVDTVSGMEGADDFADALGRMKQQAEETERRTDALVDALDGRKTAIRELARETKSEGTEMMKTYLGGEEEALDGFEFLSMAEAGELCHWEIVARIAEVAVTPKRWPSGPCPCSVGTSRPCARPRSSWPPPRRGRWPAASASSAADEFGRRSRSVEP